MLNYIVIDSVVVGKNTFKNAHPFFTVYSSDELKMININAVKYLWISSGKYFNSAIESTDSEESDFLCQIKETVCQSDIDLL